MAGRGTRLRPHTLTIPKPLLPVAGKPIVQRLAEDIVALYDGTVTEIGFVIGDFGAEVEQQLLDVASTLGAKGKIFYQEEALGTAHAIWQAQECMDDEVIIAFADTLFKADFKLDREKDGVIWVKQVDNPESFGVVTINNDGIIEGMVEKPKEFVSDLAIIGIYYLKDGPALREEIKYLLDNDIRGGGEYQLTDALESMRKKGAQIVPGEVSDWMDCGNKDAVLDTNKKVLQYDLDEGKIGDPAELNSNNSIIIPPCQIGAKVTLENAIIGPYVTIGDNTVIRNAVVKESLIGDDTTIENAVLDNSMIGNKASISNRAQIINLGDYSSTGS